MEQFIYVIVGSVLIIGVIALLAVKIEPVVTLVERYLTYAATALILFAMSFVCAEVVMRYLFNSPIPGHLEGSELLMPMIVFFAISYTQSVRGHVGMDLVLDQLNEQWRRRAEIFTLMLSIFTYAVLTYFSSAHALRSWEYSDVTSSPPYIYIWPSAAAVPLGFALCATRMVLQCLQMLYPTRYKFAEQHAPGLHGGGE